MSPGFVVAQSSNDLAAMGLTESSALRRVVVVGASLAGVRTCGGLRAEGFDGEIVLIGNEVHAPYDRPPLSKKVLAGEWEPDRIALFRAGEQESLQLDLRIGTAAVGLSIADRMVTLADASTVAYDGLVIATGAALRRLPGQPDHPSVFELRTLDDSLALRDRLIAGDQRVTVIGAGFIGLEVAATARLLGNTVTVLEGASAPLIRGLGAAMGGAVTLIHADHDVTIRCGVQVRSLQLERDSIDVHVTDPDGSMSVVVSDIVVVGVGVAPATAWLEGSGVQLRDGVVCDATLNALRETAKVDAGSDPAVSGSRESDVANRVPNVFAAGDIARWPNPQFDHEEMRVEHWTNASEQGLAVAKNLLAVGRGDAAEPFSTVPFFWSEQFGKRIQFIGRAAGDDDIAIVRGSIEDRSFLALYGKHGRLRGALGMAMPKQLMQCRALLLSNLSFDDAIEAVAAFA